MASLPPLTGVNAGGWLNLEDRKSAKGLCGSCGCVWLQDWFFSGVTGRNARALRFARTRLDHGNTLLASWRALFRS